MNMRALIRQQKANHTVMLLRREVTVIRQALERDDKAKASSAIISARRMLEQLDQEAQQLPTPSVDQFETINFNPDGSIHSRSTRDM